MVRISSESEYISIEVVKEPGLSAENLIVNGIRLLSNFTSNHNLIFN